MSYKYHCQPQAEAFAHEFLPVPEDYPLQKGLPADFRPSFAKACETMKSLYLDMAKEPEAYGLPLVDIGLDDQGKVRDSYRSIHKLADTLNALCTGIGAKNKAITARLSETPLDPDVMDTLKLYFTCWNAMKDSLNTKQTDVKLYPKEFHHRYYRFDYKVTADRAAIPVQQWIADEADVFCPDIKAFALAFYEESLKYKGVKFDGAYHYKSKRVARIVEGRISEWGDKPYRLSLKISPPAEGMLDFVKTMPELIQRRFRNDNCNFCTPGKDPCKHQFKFVLDIRRRGTHRLRVHVVHLCQL
jgi:hypothetical protein